MQYLLILSVFFPSSLSLNVFLKGINVNSITLLKYYLLIIEHLGHSDIKNRSHPWVCHTKILCTIHMIVYFLGHFSYMYIYLPGIDIRYSFVPAF